MHTRLSTFARVAGRVVVAVTAVLSVGGIAWWMIARSQHDCVGWEWWSADRGACVRRSLAGVEQPSANVVAELRCPTGMRLVPPGVSRYYVYEDVERGVSEEFETSAHDMSGFAWVLHASNLQSAVCMDVTEVRVVDYARCVSTGACLPLVTADEYVRRQVDALSAVFPGAHANEQLYREAARCNGAVPGSEDHPINCVSWAMADRYCRSVGKRLPTRSEWDLAARDGTSWGRWPPDEDPSYDPPRDCAFRPDRHDRESITGAAPITMPVGTCSIDVTPTGLRDMTGNLSEWVSDRYPDDPNGPLADATSRDGRIARDPVGPATGRFRSVVGSSGSRTWQTTETLSRGAEDQPTSETGFRCAELPTDARRRHVRVGPR